MAKKIAFVVTVFVLVFSLTMSIGCTIAWLFTETPELVNTFTPSDVEISLTENCSDTFQMIPGEVYTKDPKVSVNGAKTNMDIYLFVKFEASDNADTFLSYTTTLTEANGWKLVEGETNIWYRVVKTTDTEKSWDLLVENKVTINESVTKAQLNALTTGNYPTLNFDAAAVQFDNLDNVRAALALVVWTDET